MELKERVEIIPDVCNGRPVISGTRITAQTVLEFLGSGDSIDDVLTEYPSLSKDDITACIKYASKPMANRYEVLKIA